MTVSLQFVYVSSYSFVFPVCLCAEHQFCVTSLSLCEASFFVLQSFCVWRIGFVSPVCLCMENQFCVSSLSLCGESVCVSSLFLCRASVLCLQSVFVCGTSALCFIWQQCRKFTSSFLAAKRFLARMAHTLTTESVLVRAQTVRIALLWISE